jgi:outer membrane protein OmpA-like peptidoglycan-associated protein
VHEPVTFYFDFDSDVLTPTEEAKILAFLSYLSRFPDVVLNLQGFADRRGSAAYNINLANRRSNSVAQALLRSGIAAHRINLLPPFGRTEQFTTDAITDQDRDANRRGNRRVDITFEHTASYPGP